MVFKKYSRRIFLGFVGDTYILTLVATHFPDGFWSR